MVSFCNKYSTSQHFHFLCNNRPTNKNKNDLTLFCRWDTQHWKIQLNWFSSLLPIAVSCVGHRDTWKVSCVWGRLQSGKPGFWKHDFLWKQWCNVSFTVSYASHTHTYTHTGIVCVNRFLVAVTLLMSLTWLFLSTELYTALVYGGILDFTTVVMEESLSAQFIWDW